jgi:pimeloyl-ACP methyl ester carboxylesterase
MSSQEDQFKRWEMLKAQHGSEGPLKSYKGAVPPRPEWFEKALSHEPTSHMIDVEGTPIHYLQWGDRNKPGLLLVHGNGAHARWWSFLAPYFAVDYNVVAYDVSGMGDSGHRDSYEMEAFSDELLAVCEDGGLFEPVEPPIIVAHSFGGRISIFAASDHGDRFSGLIIADSPVNPPEKDGGPPEREARPHRPYSTLNEALGRFRLMPPQGCDNHYIVDYIARHSLREVEGGWIWKFDPKIWRRFDTGNMSERLKLIPCRLGIIRGENSFLFPREVGDYMYELLGRSVPVIEIPEARHHIMLDEPLAFVSAVRALLEDWNHSHPSRQI